MKPALPLVAVAAILLAGCATQTKEQLAAVRAAHVSPALLDKLEHRGILKPADLIELKQRHVDDAVAIRQLDSVGVDYVLGKYDGLKMRYARVSPEVFAALDQASRRALRVMYWPGPPYPYPGWGAPWAYPYDPFFYDPLYPYARVGFVTPYRNCR